MDIKSVRQNLFVGYEYSPEEVKADAWVHAAGVTFALIAVPWLMVKVWPQGDWLIFAATAIYGIAVLAVLSVSAAYNLSLGAVHDRLRPFDHAMIFLLIAASYSPYLVLRLPEPMNMWIGGIVWAGALLGAAGKLRFPNRYDRAYIPLYLGLGWVIVWAIEPLGQTMLPANFALLVAGGVLYTAGIPFYLMDKMPYHNAIWHCFVLAGVICHFCAVSGEVLRPIG